MNKRSQAGLVAIVIILIALVFIGWLVKINSRECNSNDDCGKESYCGSDFACHNMPVIEKTVTKRSYTGPTIVVCLTIIILAIISRWEKIFTKKGSTPKIDTQEPYYTSQVKYTAK